MRKSPGRTTCAYGRDTYREMGRRECGGRPAAPARFCTPFCPKGGYEGLRSRAAACGRNRRSGAGAAVCFLQGRHDARRKSREPQPNGFLPRGCAQKWVPPNICLIVLGGDLLFQLQIVHLAHRGQGQAVDELVAHRQHILGQLVGAQGPQLPDDLALLLLAVGVQDDVGQGQPGPWPPRRCPASGSRRSGGPSGRSRAGPRPRRGTARCRGRSPSAPAGRR